MSRGIFIKTCLLLAVTTHVQTQYIDFFNSFLQPFTTSKPRNEATKRPDKHRQTNKQNKYQDVIFFETDDFLKRRNSKTVDPFNIFPTTAKPKRKSKTTTSHYNSQTTKPKTVDSNIIINNNNRTQQERSIGDNSRFIDTGRRIDNVYNYNTYTTKSPNRQTTKTTQNYRQTTRNPLLNRPGVRPAVVDHNKPPITNRPVTQKPYNPYESRPVTEKPYNPYETRPSVTEKPYNPYESRPITQKPATQKPYNTYESKPATQKPYNPYESRPPRPPVNTRPPFETERPNISTGVVQPPSGTNEDTEIDIEIGPDEDDMTDAEKRRLYDVCEKKCEEYKSMHVRKVVALPLQAGEVNVSSCAPDTVPLIVGGQLARIETFPHMALLGWKYIQTDGYAWKCGGSLVSDQYVLTAGHCTYFDKDSNVVSGPPAVVQLGSSIYNDRSATVARVTLVVRHPKYKLRRSYYDVALLKLAAQIKFSDTISPACLGVPPPVGQPIVATGWGKTEYGGDSSVQLRSVSIPVWDMSDCREIWGTSLKLPNGPMPDNQICAGERNGNKDTCQGDSGGPAQVRDGCAWRVVAVTSVGRSCGARDTPALYARVPRAFIAKQVYTNVKSERDGNSQYGNLGNNGNNNGNRNNNNRNGNNNWNTANNYGAGNNNRETVSNQNGNWGVNTNNQNNNGQVYNNGRLPNNNNNQAHANSQSSSTTNRGTVNNYNGNSYNSNNRDNWGSNPSNNGYNQNNNRNVYDQGYNYNEQTTNGYNQNFNQNNFNANNFGYNRQSQNGRNQDNSSDGNTDNRYNNGYNSNNNEYNAYPVVSRPWWMK